MPNELPLPPELMHLIEKREAGERRADPQQVDTQKDSGDLPTNTPLNNAAEPAENVQQPSAEQRRQEVRRANDK